MFFYFVRTACRSRRTYTVPRQCFGTLARSLAALACLTTFAIAQETTALALVDDPILVELVDTALANRPELAEARANIQADLARAHQAGALPDPSLSLGIQNDSFKSIEIGRMESSYLSIAASQTFPWFGKRALRTDSQSFGTRQSEAQLEQAIYTVRAQVETAYIDLLLVRDRLGLLETLDGLWTQAEGYARIRYELGEGAQSDLLRAQLEHSRLKQRRWALTAQERRTLAELNRLRAYPLDASIVTDRSLMRFPDPTAPTLTAALQDAEARSPDLRSARLAIEASEVQVDLAHKDFYPDLTVSGGAMLRWGNFGPMWQLGVSFPLPIWAGRKQSSAVGENQFRQTAARSKAEAIRQLLAQKVTERLALLEALCETNKLYRSGLLDQSRATALSTLAQYQVGRVSFASVLEALNGYVSDLDAFYASVAAAQRVGIAERAVSLDALGGSSSGALGTSAIADADDATADAPADSSSSSSSMSKM